jgi:penicillin-binding protein 2
MALLKDEKLPSIRLTVSQAVIAVILLVLTFGLWRLQIVGAQNYHALAEANRIRKVPILAPRGEIFDRDGRLIVTNYQSVSCYLARDQKGDLKPDLPLIAKGLNMTVDQIEQIIHRYRWTPSYEPIPLKEDIPPSEQQFIAAHSDELPELETIREWRRLYPRNGFLAAAIGYVGQVSDRMLNDPRYAYYQPGDVVGESGVEESYDSILRGVDGAREILVNSRGQEVGVLGTKPAKPGKNLKLTIDLDIQRAAENAMGNRSGAVIALDPHNGQILALVSRPTFDPNDFAVGISSKEWNSLVTNPDHPLMDKAIQATSAPGSTFKPIVAVAGMQAGIAEKLKVDCRGGAYFYGRWFACDRKHGEVTLATAIPYSCDTYFYTLAHMLGIDRISKWAHRFGIGEKTGVDLPGEVAGIMPSKQWEMKTYHQMWNPSVTVSVGIGQGPIALTPIQLARAIGGIASGGVLKRPHIVFRDEVTPEYRKYMRMEYPGSGNQVVHFSTQAWEEITNAMANVTQSSIGTAYSSKLQGIDFAGKTGTAQVVSHNFGVDKISSQMATRPNAWFVGLAPRRNPDIVVVVFWQHGGWGTDVAHIAAQVIDAYVTKQRRLDHNLLADEPGASTAKKGVNQTGKLDVGAVWSNPDAPKALGGKPLYPDAARDTSAAAMYAGHFWLNIPDLPGK